MVREIKGQEEKLKVRVRREKNSIYRSREYLTIKEVQQLIEAAQLVGRHPVRDRTLLLLMFRHGLRASEVGLLRWDAVMLRSGTIALTRLKGSESGLHPLQPDECEALQELRQVYPDSSWLFVNERGKVLSRESIGKIVERAGKLAELPLPVHPHMLRHACGYHLANQGLDTRLIQEWLGHRNIQHTVQYTKLNPKRFNEIRWN